MKGYALLTIPVPGIFSIDASEEIAIDVDWSGSPGSPGRKYGPPEDCEPPEPATVNLDTWAVAKDDPLHDHIEGVRKLGTKATTEQLKGLADIEATLEKQLAAQAEDLIQNAIDAAEDLRAERRDDYLP